jgi:NAD(P)-dependent dehydrogenase (short-subunit alcohol dehydrogenase family)
MKVLVIGANGLIGNGVANVLRADHEVIGASRSGEVTVDITKPDSIAAMYAQVGKVDAVVSCIGKVPFKALAELGHEDYVAGMMDKAIGQVELVRQGIDYVNDGGSFTLTTGILAREPIRTGAVASLANGAVEAFVMAAAIELPRGIRINVVSPSVLVEAESYHPYFPGFIQVSLAEVANAYVKSVAGWSTGQVIELG